MTMKRSLSDSESDTEYGDDLKSDVTSPSQSHQSGGTDRKKRRGVIEKRRRDRINNSLAELRRLVPTAFEKQGSAKLEKAEILQMTVDHLKLLHQKGMVWESEMRWSQLSSFPTLLRGVPRHTWVCQGTAGVLTYTYFKLDKCFPACNDYVLEMCKTEQLQHRSNCSGDGLQERGIPECAAEVARYLVTCEGMDIQDPLRLRLMSHLQCYSAQREVQKANLPGQGWGMGAHHPGTGLSSGLSSMTHGQYGTGSAMSSLPHMISASQHTASQDQLTSLTAPHHPSGLSSSGCPPDAVSRLPPPPTTVTSQHGASLVDSHTHAQTAAHMRLPAAGSVAPQMPSVTSTTSTSSGVLHSQYMHTQFPSIHSSLGMNSVPMLSPSGAHSYSPPTSSALGQSTVKPYRPWGAELAY